MSTSCSSSFPVKDLEIAVRFGTYDSDQLFIDWTQDPPVRWINCNAVWHHKFLLKYLFSELLNALRNDRERYRLWEHTSGSVWVRAI